MDAAVRRAISTAYYALFAAICEEAARPYRSEAGVAARRLLGHGSARDVCARLVSQKRVDWLEGRPACNADLWRFAASFVGLQGARRSADYDDVYSARKDFAREAIADARSGVERLHRARLAAPEQVPVMCVAMLAGPAERRRMTR